MELRDYQKDISEKAAITLNEFGLVYLSLEVRTGKTITALNTAKIAGAKNVLFVTKLKAIKSILNDYEYFKKDYDITVINYESAHKTELNYDLIICDEAHCLGQFPKPAKKTQELKNKFAGKKIIYLSGTPAPESHSQLFHQFWISSFSPFKEYRNFYGWAKQYVIPKIKHLYNREIMDYSNAKTDLINEKVKHLFYSFTQREAGFDVAVNENILTVKMNDRTYNLIHVLQRDLIIKGNKSEILADTAVKLMQKVHQMYSGTVILENKEAIILDESKAEFIKREFAGQKIAIFYKFNAELELLKKHFDYTQSPEEFQESENKTYLGQFISSREGIRLDKADAIIFYNIDFSYLSYEQSKNRLISKERTKPANVYWIFAENGIEIKIYERVLNKQDYTLNFYKNDFRIKHTSKDYSALRE